MAIATRVKARPSFPVGEGRVVRGTVTEDVTAGELLIRGANGWSRSTAADPANKRGFAAQDYKAGDAHCSILLQGQMEGWTGLTPGAPLYPAAGGALETVAVAGFTGLIHAISATAVEFVL
jgi:hypothetical protein